MTRQRLALGLVQGLVAAFEPVLPDDLYLVLAGRDLTARSLNGGSASGFALGRRPWLPMPEAVKFRLAIQDSCEAIAWRIGSVATPGPRHQAQLPMWPTPDAAVKVEVHGQQITIRFVAKSGRELLALDQVTWSGPRFVTVAHGDLTDGTPRQYVGKPPAKDITFDRQRDGEEANRAAAASALVEMLMAQDLGTDKNAIRHAFRVELESRPAVEVPPDSRSEDRVVDMVASANGHFPRTQASLIVLRGIVDLARVVRGMHADGDDEQEDPDGA